MLTAEMERQSCLASAEQWRRQAEQVREHAGRSYLQPRQRDALLAEADACDRQADWWVDGANDYVPAAATAGWQPCCGNAERPAPLHVVTQAQT